MWFCLFCPLICCSLLLRWPSLHALPIAKPRHRRSVQTVQTRPRNAGMRKKSLAHHHSHLRVMSVSACLHVCMSGNSTHRTENGPACSKAAHSDERLQNIVLNRRSGNGFNSNSIYMRKTQHKSKP